jgi:hypothetical protein
MNTKDLCDRLEYCARTGLYSRLLLLEARNAILQLDRQRGSMLHWLDETKERIDLAVAAGTTEKTVQQWTMGGKE